VSQSRKVGDELGRWATERAPALLTQAEAEAVAAIRDALVAAAIRGGKRDREVPSDDRPEVAEPQRVDPAELRWAYCVLRASDPHPSGMMGVEESVVVQCEEVAGLVALVSRVPQSEFAAEPLRANLNDLAWLERVARQHEAVLEATLATSTIVPLRMCTIYESAESVRLMLEREHDSLVEALRVLDGRVEWAVKVLVNRETLMESARQDAEASSPDQGPGRGEGGAYMLQRRRDRAAREAAEATAAEVAEQVHSRLQDWAVNATIRPPQNRELSGHQGDMLLNAAYLVERERSEELPRLVAGLENHYRELGVRIELTGPWPPYNFVPGGSAAALG
jgi:Gas vesicle synthesis protein GvpL/GvpF